MNSKVFVMLPSQSSALVNFMAKLNLEKRECTTLCNGGSTCLTFLNTLIFQILLLNIFLKYTLKHIFVGYETLLEHFDTLDIFIDVTIILFESREHFYKM